MSTWTPERDELLKTLVAEGRTYSVIGTRLGITSNAAIGRAARLGLGNFNATWSEERVAQLKTLWCVEGLTASQCAARLGHGISRNAVVSKVHRLGWIQAGSAATRRSASGALQRKPKQFLKKTYTSNLRGDERATVAVGPDLVIPPAERRALVELENNDCRWPYGSGEKDDPFYFCGKPKVPGKPYCPFHTSRAFNPPAARTRVARAKARELEAA